MREKMGKKMQRFAHNNEGRIAVPIMMWILGVPAGLCFLAWLFFFRG